MEDWAQGLCQPGPKLLLLSFFLGLHFGKCELPWEFPGARQALPCLAQGGNQGPTERSEGVVLSSASPFRIQILSAPRAALALRGGHTLAKLVRLVGEVLLRVALPQHLLPVTVLKLHVDFFT